MKLSVTHLAAYLYCKRKLWMNEVLKLKEPPKAALVKGSVRHKIHELISKDEQRIVTSVQRSDRGHILELYLRSYKRIMNDTLSSNVRRLGEFNVNLSQFQEYTWDLLIEEANLRTDNVYQFAVQHNVFGSALWERLTPKIESEVRIESDDLQLKGIIDQVFVYDEGIVPVELKTGKMPREGVWPGHKIQVAAYALLLEEQRQQEVKEAFVRYLDGKEQRHISLNPFLREEIKDLVRDVTQLLKKRDIPDRVSNVNKCQACGLRKQCYDDRFITHKVKVLKQTTLE